MTSIDKVVMKRMEDQITKIKSRKVHCHGRNI
jgi:hypothetical protein